MSNFAAFGSSFLVFSPLPTTQPAVPCHPTTPRAMTAVPPNDVRTAVPEGVRHSLPLGDFEEGMTGPGIKSGTGKSIWKPSINGGL